MKIDVLDKGHVQYMDHMGSDLSVVNAARVSFDKESDWMTSYPTNPEDGTIDYTTITGVYLSDRDTKLINYLARHDHWTPFGQVNLKLRIKMPIFVARQLMRSNIGIVWNEVSRRYVDTPPEFYEPEVWRGRPEGNIKQGSGGELPHDLWLETDEWEGYLDRDVGEYTEHMYYLYDAMIQAGVSPEQSRMVLPQSTYTEVIGNFTLAALARVYTQRADSHAQWEIRQYSKAMNSIAREYFPVSWEALTGGDAKENDTKGYRVRPLPIGPPS